MILILGEFDVWDSGASAQITLYAGTMAYTSRPGDTPANKHFLGRLIEAPVLRQDMFNAATVSGRSGIGIGKAVLNNADHGIDFWLDYAFDGRECRFWWADFTGAVGDLSFPSDFTEICIATMVPPVADDQEITLNFRDGQAALEVPLQVNRYAGDNSLPGGLAGVDDLKGKPIPFALGSSLNQPAPSVNTSRYIYQANDGAVASLTPYVAGIEIPKSTPSWEIFGGGSVGALSASNICQGLAYGAGVFVAIGTGNATIYYSDDAGETWTVALTPPAGTTFYKVAFGGGIFMAVGDSTANDAVYTSSDGISWSSATVPTGTGFGATGGIDQLLYMSDVDRWFVATSGGGGGAYSDNQGSTWTTLAWPWCGNTCTGLAYDPATTKAVALSPSSSTRKWKVSTDHGVTWSLDSGGTGSTALGSDITFGLGYFVMRDPATGVWYHDDPTIDTTWTQITASPLNATFSFIKYLTNYGIVLSNTTTFLVCASDPTSASGWAAESFPFDYAYTTLAAATDGASTWRTDLFGTGSPSGSHLEEVARHKTYDHYISESELTDADMAPPPGTYLAYLEGGYARLGTSPAQSPVTFDIVQGATTADRKASALIQAVLEKIGMTAGDWSASDITALGTALTAELGFWSGLDELMAAAVLDKICNSGPAWWGADELKVIRCGVLADPDSMTSVASLTIADVWKQQGAERDKGGTTLRRRRPEDLGGGVPFWRTVVGYGRLGLVQTSDLGGSVSDDRVQRLAQEYLTETDEDASIKTAHPLAQEMVRNTLILGASDAAALATTLLALFGVNRAIYEWEMAYDPSTAVAIGQAITLTHPYYGLDGGKKLVVIKREIRPSAKPPAMAIGAWG